MPTPSGGGGGTVRDADVTHKGILRLGGDLGGTADTPRTNLGLDPSDGDMPIWQGSGWSAIQSSALGGSLPAGGPETVLGLIPATNLAMTNNGASNSIAGDANAAVIGATGAAIVLPTADEAFSIAIAFRLTSANDMYAIAVGKSGPTASGPALEIAAGVLYFFDNNNAPAFNINTSGVNDDGWHFAVGTWAGAATPGRLYLDGAQVAASGNVAHSNNDSTNRIKIGGGLTGNWFNGSVAHAQIYRRALSAGDVAALYAARTTGYAAAVLAAAPLVYYPMQDPVNDGPTYTRMRDFGGHGYDLPFNRATALPAGPITAFGVPAWRNAAAAF